MNDEAKKAWMEFQKAGLFWWINRSLHLLGWALVRVHDKDTGELLQLIPERVKYRGFSRESEEEGFTNLTAYIHKNAARLKTDLEE